LPELLTAIPGAETLPGLPTTGWEETTLLAAVMTANPDEFVRGLMETNLALAGRCAGQSEARDRVGPDLMEDLRRALVTRSTDPEADLRARIEAALALGPLRDPRLERCAGSLGDYLLPPMVEIPAGRYPMGEDEALEYLGKTIRSHLPRHEVEIGPFVLGQFPVTNAEWALFQESGGYEDERWWDTAAARRWRSGDGTADGTHAQVRYWLGVFQEDPDKLESARESGQMPEESYERWKKRFSMSERALETHLRELYPGGVLREPMYWRDPVYNSPALPVGGVSWFEARAYCRWLSAQSGEDYRLPTEAECEAAARGQVGRLFAYGDDFDPLKGNTAETRLKRPTPVGVFVEGETPEGISDLAGNVGQWTSSLFGPGASDEAAFSYPYRPEDGREDPGAGSNVRRVLRGGSWSVDRVYARATCRVDRLPGNRNNGHGFRLARIGGARRELVDLAARLVS
jgi:formylglycine-generating enzyme required for sulfatase activity